MFEPRLTIPPKDNRFYIAKSEGGLNPCIPRPSGSKLRFANCVFYAVGRFAEVCGIWLKSTNAENFANIAKEMGLTISDKPQPGAVIVWAKGNIGDGSDGAGHVAVVEIINQSGSIVTSESGWNAKKEFWTQTRRNDGNWGQSAAYKFIGFILPPESAVTVLRKGDRGEQVKRMQTALADRGYLRKSEIDGDFGKITLGALLAFQFEHGLDVDGIAGPQTQAAIGLL
jgi:murein L,D-transpeptidase YcbB/YkuD